MRAGQDAPAGIKIAVNHGAAVTMIDRCTLPGNWRVLDDADGLPPASCRCVICPPCRFLHRRPVFLHAVYAGSSKLGMCRTAETASVRSMTFIHPVPTFDVAGRQLRARAHPDVIPLAPPRPRLQLPVTLTADSGEHARARLAALLHSPLGVYVVSARAVRDVIHVRFDIAPEDLEFTLHMLIAQQTDAVIGPVARRLRIAPSTR